jgi:hypothetical protein
MWHRELDDENNVYFWNDVTGASQWAKPTCSEKEEMLHITQVTVLSGIFRSRNLYRLQRFFLRWLCLANSLYLFPSLISAVERLVVLEQEQGRIVDDLVKCRLRLAEAGLEQ